MLPRIALALSSIALTLYQHGYGVSHDGRRLMARPRPSPFNLRWLLPAICQRRIWTWAIVSWISLVASSVLFPGDVWAVALWVCLPWFRTMAQLPVLTDAPALALSLSTRSLPARYPLATRWLPVALALIGGSVSERVPVWMGLFGARWDVVYVGLCAVLIAWQWTTSGPREGESAPRVGRMRAARWTDMRALLLPWGAGLAAMLSPDWSGLEIATVAIAYGQMFVVHDTIRMYQWAAPVVLPRAVSVLPPPLRLPAVIATWFNPWARCSTGQVLC